MGNLGYCGDAGQPPGEEAGHPPEAEPQPAPPEQAPEPVWYYRQGSETRGPVTVAALTELLE